MFRCKNVEKLSKLRDSGLEGGKRGLFRAQTENLLATKSNPDFSPNPAKHFL